MTASVLGARSVVERGAHVENSVLLPGARVGAGARVCGIDPGPQLRGGRGHVSSSPVTVVGDDVVVPEGARLTDARVPAEMAS